MLSQQRRCVNKRSAANTNSAVKESANARKATRGVRKGSV